MKDLLPGPAGIQRSAFFVSKCGSGRARDSFWCRAIIVTEYPLPINTDDQRLLDKMGKESLCPNNTDNAVMAF
jgi:hypothetical protein